MTRQTFRRVWLIGAGVLLFVAIDVPRAANWLERAALAMIGGLLFWDVMKDR